MERIRFDNLSPYEISRTKEQVPLRGAFRRLFFGYSGVGKFEVGITAKPPLFDPWDMVFRSR
jgi:hypothetical protein